jgi:hypothetical protein
MSEVLKIGLILISGVTFYYCRGQEAITSWVVVWITTVLFFLFINSSKLHEELKKIISTIEYNLDRFDSYLKLKNPRINLKSLTIGLGFAFLVFAGNIFVSRFKLIWHFSRIDTSMEHRSKIREAVHYREEAGGYIKNNSTGLAIFAYKHELEILEEYLETVKDKDKVKEVMDLIITAKAELHKLTPVSQVKEIEAITEKTPIENSNQVIEKVEDKLVYKKSCDAGEINDCLLLGFVEAKKGNVAKARPLFTKACDRKIKDGCFSLGLLEEVEGNLDLAKNIYKKTCIGGVVQGCFRLGIMEDKQGNMSKAKPLFKKSCDHKIMEGCSNLGIIELKWGNIPEAGQLFKKACDGGYSDACGFLTEFDGKNGTTVQSNHKKVQTKIAATEPKSAFSSQQEAVIPIDSQTLNSLSQQKNNVQENPEKQDCSWVKGTITNYFELSNRMEFSKLNVFYADILERAYVTTNISKDKFIEDMNYVILNLKVFKSDVNWQTLSVNKTNLGCEAIFQQALTQVKLDGHKAESNLISTFKFNKNKKIYYFRDKYR